MIYLEGRDWPKWPRLLVKGKKIKTWQATEILLRTDTYLYWGTGDTPPNLRRKAEQTVIDLLAHYSTTLSDKEILQLDLCYLKTSRLISNWVGGLYGWVDINGNVRCHEYNIGKWPTPQEVYEEWELVAKTWPFLDLTCQVANQEYDIPTPLIEYRVKEGRVQIIYPPNKPLFTKAPSHQFRLETTHIHPALLKKRLEEYTERVQSR